MLEILNGENWDVLGEFNTVEELKKHLEIEYELEEEEINEAIADLKFKAGEVLVKNVLGDGEVELYDNALSWEMERFDSNSSFCQIEDEVLEILGCPNINGYTGYIESHTLEFIDSIENDRVSVLVDDKWNNEYKITMELKKSDVQALYEKYKDEDEEDIDDMVCGDILDKKVKIINIELV